MPTFTTQLQLEGSTSGIAVPEDVVESFGAGKRVPVVITLGDYQYRSTVSPYKGQYMISLSRANLAGAGLVGDETMEVTLEHDTAPRVVDVPPELADVLATDAAAKAAFEKLSYTNQNRLALSVREAKTDETRERRLGKALAELRG